MTTDITVPPQKDRGIKRREIRKWWLRLTLGLTILGPLIFAVAALGYKLGLMDLGAAFGLNRGLGPKVLMASIPVAAIALMMAILIQPRKGYVVGIIALLVPVLGLGKLGAVKKTADKLPLIHDITTDTQDVPKFTDAILTERAKTDGVNPVVYAGKTDLREKKLVSALQTRAYPEISSLVLSEEPKVVYGKAEAAASSMGWDIVTADAEAGLIEATDTTFWYGFKDDVVIRIRPSEGGGTVVDMRSISRVGQSDLGKNADRIRSFMAKLKEG